MRHISRTKPFKVFRKRVKSKICIKLYSKNLESHPLRCGPSSISLVIFVEKIEVNETRSLQFHSFICSLSKICTKYSKYVLKKLLQLLRVVYSYFYGQNRYKIIVSLHYSVCTKNWKNTILRFRIYFLCQNRLDIVDEKEERPSLLYLIQIFGFLLRFFLL